MFSDIGVLLHVRFLMRTYFSLLLCVTVFYVSPVFATSDCSSGNNDQEVHTCTQKNRNETELDLNKEYKLAKTRVETLFKGDNKELSQYMDALTEAQRAWLKYRENDCKLASYAADKGSDLSNANINMCTSELNGQRIKKLKLIPYH